MITGLVELIVGLLTELIFEGLGELVSEAGFRYFEKTRESGPLGETFRIVTYTVVGALLGVASYFVLPVHLIDSVTFRAGWVIVSAAATGLMLCLITWFVARKDRNETFFSAAKFGQGVVFGLSYSLTRAWAVG